MLVPIANRIIRSLSSHCLSSGQGEKVFCGFKRGDDPQGLELSGNFIEEFSSIHIYQVP